MPVPVFSVNEVLTSSAMNQVGLWKVGEFTASGSSRALVCDNIFTTNFDNYRVIVRLSSTILTNALFYQYLDTSGNSVSSGYYGTAYGQDFTTGGTAWTVNSATTVQYIGWLPTSSSNPMTAAFDVISPRLSTLVTTVHGQHSSISSGFSYLGGQILGMTTGTTAFRGLRFDNGGAGNLTGKVTVYGYRI